MKRTKTRNRNAKKPRTPKSLASKKIVRRKKTAKKPGRKKAANKRILRRALRRKGTKLRARRKKPKTTRRRKVRRLRHKPYPSTSVQPLVVNSRHLLPAPRPGGSRLRILIWASIMSLGGGTRVLASLVPAIARQEGVEHLRVVVSSRSGFKSSLDTSPYPNLVIDEFDDPIESPAAVPFLQQADVVYFFWPHGLHAPSLPLPTVCTVQDLTVLDFAAPFALGSDLKLYWGQMKGWVDQTTCLIAPANDVKNRMAAHFGERAHESFTIPFIHSSKLTDPNLGRTGAAAQLPAEYLVYPANTSPHKNHYNLLLAYSRFAYRKRLPLVLIGYMTDELRRVPPDYPEIAYQSTLTTLIRRTGLVHGEDFFALGFIPDQDITSVIKHAKGLIMPTLSEGGGIPLFEAFSLGVPVLCSDIPVFREHVGNEGRSDHALWFDPEWPDSITNALHEFTGNYDYYKQLALSPAQVQQETWDDTARKYVDVFYTAHKRFHGY